MRLPKHRAPFFSNLLALERHQQFIQQAIYHSWQSSVDKKNIVIIEDFFDGNRGGAVDETPGVANLIHH
jgi:hypothetical protein